MFTLSPQFVSSPCRSLQSWTRRSVPVVLLSVGLLTSGFSLVANSAEAPISLPKTSQAKTPVQPKPATAKPATVKPVSGSSTQDGMYLFGQSAKPDQIGKAYAVLEIKQGKVMGAFYMPYSSFDCVHGTLKADKLALTVIDSYERTSRPYSIALERSYPVAAVNGKTPSPGFRLQGFHPLAALSDNDQRMLNVCKADLQNQGVKSSSR